MKKCSEEEEDDNFCHLLRWLCCKKMAKVTTFAFYGGFVAKKVMATMSSPFSMVVVL
jgi:hypothetical protein